MSAATIVFMDVVGFSRKDTATQRTLIEDLTDEVVHELRTLLAPPLETPGIIALPTGDGMALAFLHTPNRRWTRETILGLIFRLHRWAGKQSGGNISVALRVGVHVGAVELITDINGRPNVCGNTINYAQRVMDAANPRQTLFSDDAFREYVGTENPSGIIPPGADDGTRLSYLGPIEVYAKHGQQILVYKLILEPDKDDTDIGIIRWWTNNDPAARQYMLVSLTPLPKEIIGDFSQKLEQAQQIALVQLTGDRLLGKLTSGEVRLSDELKRLWIFMPEPSTYSNFNISSPHAAESFVTECVAQWRTFLQETRQKLPGADLKLGLFSEPPFYGGSYLDWERPDGQIHISPYVWGVNVRRCPGYDLQWLGKKPSPVYEAYVEGLRHLDLNTENALKQE